MVGAEGGLMSGKGGAVYLCVLEAEGPASCGRVGSGNWLEDGTWLKEEDSGLDFAADSRSRSEVRCIDC